MFCYPSCIVMNNEQTQQMEPPNAKRPHYVLLSSGLFSDNTTLIKALRIVFINSVQATIVLLDQLDHPKCKKNWWLGLCSEWKSGAVDKFRHSNTWELSNISLVRIFGRHKEKWASSPWPGLMEGCCRPQNYCPKLVWQRDLRRVQIQNAIREAVVICNKLCVDMFMLISMNRSSKLNV